MKKVSFYDVHYRNDHNLLYKNIRHDTWDPQDIGITSFFSTQQVDKFIAWFDLKPGMFFIDACCGNGGVTSYVTQKSNSKSYGVDINDHSIKAAKKRAQQNKLSAQFIKTDLKEKLPFSDASFDALICLESIIHFSVEDRLNIFKEWHRILRPAAKLILTDPCIISGGISDIELAHRSLFGGYFFLPLGLQENLLENSGFSVIKTENLTKDNAAVITHNWWTSREKRKKELESTETNEEFDQIQLFLKSSAQLYQDEKLAQYGYYASRV